MSIIKDTFFGGAQKKAAKAQAQGIERGIEATERATSQARADIDRMFPNAQQSAEQGFQSAMDILAGSLPAQADVFQQGNVAAQNAILAGMPQAQSAILGGNVNFGAFQPFQAQMPNLDFMNQSLPSFGERQEKPDAVLVGPDRVGDPLFNTFNRNTTFNPEALNRGLSNFDMARATRSIGGVPSFLGRG